MAELKTLEVKIQPKFVIDEDTAYQCITLLEMYCNFHNKVIKSFLRKAEDSVAWSINLDFEDVNTYEDEKREVAREVQNFVEERCKKLDIDYTQIFTSSPID